MTPAHKRELARCYRESAHYIDRRLASVSCGRELLRHISVDFDRACREIESIEQELREDPDFQAWQRGMKQGLQAL